MIVNFLKIMCYIGYGVGIVLIIGYAILYMQAKIQSKKMQEMREEEEEDKKED